MRYQYSYSRFKNFEICPLLFKLINIEKVKIGKSVPMAIGSIGHDAIQEYTRHCLEKKLQSDLAVVEDIAIKVFNEDGTLESKYLDEIINLMRCYTDSHLIDYQNIVGAEEEIALNEQLKRVTWLAEDVFIRFKLDLLQIKDNVAKITDYKTGWSMDYDKFQLKMYAWAVSVLYPQVEWFQVALDFVRFETFREEEFGVKDVERTKKQVMALVNRIEKLGLNDFLPMPGKGCEFCGCWKWCPKVDLNKVDRVPQNVQEALKLAEDILCIEGVYNQKKGLLKKYCADAGHIQVNNVEFGHWENITKRVDASEFFTLMSGLNRAGEAFDYFSVDNRKLQKLMKEDELREKLGQISKEETSVRFDKKKIKAKEEVKDESGNNKKDDRGQEKKEGLQD